MAYIVMFEGDVRKVDIHFKSVPKVVLYIECRI